MSHQATITQASRFLSFSSVCHTQRVQVALRSPLLVVRRGPLLSHAADSNAGQIDTLSYPLATGLISMAREMPIERRRSARLRFAAAAVRAPGQIDNESSCSSPADGTPRSPADDTRTSLDKESPCSHSSTCRRSSSILCRLDSGQQPHPRNMDDSKDVKLLRILGYTRVHQKQINSRWYQEDAVLERISKSSTLNSIFPGIDMAMLKQRILKFEKMVIDYYEGKQTTMPNQDLMLHVFSNIMYESEQIPETQLNSGKRATLVSEELEAPSTKRARSESVNMAMYLSNPDAASKLLKGGLGMDDCTTRAEYLLHDSHMLYPAITLLRQDIEIRQSFMTFGDSHARGYIEYELKQHGML